MSPSASYCTLLNRTVHVADDERGGGGVHIIYMHGQRKSTDKLVEPQDASQDVLVLVWRTGWMDGWSVVWLAIAGWMPSDGGW